MTKTNIKRNSIQDQINEDKDKVIAALENYEEIPYEYCEHLVKGARIKYISNEGLLGLVEFCKKWIS